MKEIEIKLAVTDVEALKSRLDAMGWRVCVPRQIERNLVYDYPDQSLFRSGRLLRLRQVGEQGWMTVKGPPQRGTAHKVREEHEIETTEIETLSRMFEILGYELLWRYEKFRAVYECDGEPGHVFVDETPIGNFMELEGDAAWIDQMAAKLGFSASDYVKSSYRELFVKYQQQHPDTGKHMVFR